jgi:adenine-specific DNA-methyltransferase
MAMLKVEDSFDRDADIILYQGDCRDLLRQIPAGMVKLVVTSPPYNIGKPYEKRIDLNVYVEQQREVIGECVRILGEKGSICWQVGNYVSNDSIMPLDIVLYPVFQSLNLVLKNRVIWHFEHGLHCKKRFSGRYETILWFVKGSDYTFNLDPLRVPQKYSGKKYYKGPKVGQPSCHPLGKNPGDIWLIPNVKHNHVEKTIHPCQFPVELIERLILALTDEGDWVFDPFMGVGTTAIAAAIHGRKAIGAEIVPEYTEVARKRIHDAEEGTLRIRPMDRPVYDPSNLIVSKPPKVIKLGQPTLW